MKLGIYLNGQHPEGDDPARRFAEVVEQARLIRQLGFDSIWGGEHHITDGFHYFPLLPLLQRLAAETEGMWLGTNVVLMPLHNPVELAEIGAFLDVITGGRFILGAGLGYRPEEFAVFNVPLKQRVSRTEEGIEIVRRLWSEDRVTYKGRYWQLDNVTIRPRPIQSPRPPIVVAAQVDAAIERAARIADGWTLVPLPKGDVVASQIELFRKAREAAGHAPSPHIVRLYEVSCARDEETALRRAAPYLVGKYAAYASWGLLGVKIDAAAPPEAQLRGLAAGRFGIGTPAQVIEALMEQHRLGITHLTMRVSWPGMSQDEILSGIQILGREVLPEVRRRLRRQ